MRAEFISHVGAVRDKNEDAIYCDVKNNLFIVADGIGGKEAGEIASSTAVRMIADKYWNDPQTAPDILLKEAFYEANNFLNEKGKNPGLDGMGTTLTAAVVKDDKITIVHVGDSRAYLINDQEIKQLTTDHTWVDQLVKEGQITREQAKTHPRRNVLTRAIGQDTLVEVDVAEATWTKGDFLLLCSDGLYNLVSEQEMQENTLRFVDLRTAVEFMAKSAFNRGGYDNISVVLISHD